MSNYVKTVDFAIKDGLASGNPAKIIKGTEHDTEYNNIATMSATKADLASPTFTGSPLAPLAAVGTNTTQIASTSFVQQEAVFMYGARGLIGVNNSGSPTTKYDLSADYVQLIRPAAPINSTVIRSNVSVLTNDLGLSGPSANGRDQSGVFGASNWVHLYFIWNGATLATLSSLNAPPTGPTLPAGYTHWCYTTTLRLDSGSALIPGYLRGNTFFYDLPAAGSSRVLSHGTATSFTAVDCSTRVPPNTVTTQVELVGATGTVIGNYDYFLRPTGSTITGYRGLLVYQAVTSANTNGSSILDITLGTSNQIDYKNVTANGSDLSIDVLSYSLPNGAI